MTSLSIGAAAGDWVMAVRMCFQQLLGACQSSFLHPALCQANFVETIGSQVHYTSRLAMLQW